MRVPLSWLREYVDVDLTPRQLAEELTVRGMEVGGIETAGADWTDVVVARVLDVRRHPNADALWLTRIDVGASGGEIEIVTGAENLQVGQLVPAALVGAVLPGNRRIERTKIRGEVSSGMLCGEADLGLGDDTDDILVLGNDDIAPGTPLADVVGETVLDVDVKPNRGDALCIVGLAREVAAFTGAALRMPDATVVESDDPTDAHVTVRIEEPELNPRFAARWFDGVRNGPSPEWMQRRLAAVGMRPVSAVVDVTNYVMHEIGQPLHAYDADTIPDGELVVRRARAGERLETLDHVERELDDLMLIIADRDDRPIDLAGIMGGASTEVGEGTTRVILESAYFHGPTIRNTARRLGLRSEASMRHEKGLWPDLPRFAANRAARLIVEITGAQVARGIVDNDPEPKPPRRVSVEVPRMRKLLGIDVDAPRVRELLAPLEFTVTGEGDVVEVEVPSHRLDVTLPADVAEEVARAYGYERIPGRLPTAALPPYRPDPSEPRHVVRRILAGLGLDEVVGHALIGPDDLERVGRDPSDPELVRLYNPLSPQHSILRPSMTPSMLAGLAENARRRRNDAWLFDLGKVYRHPATPSPRDHASETAGTGRYESWELGIALSGAAAPAAAGAQPLLADVGVLKGIVDALHDGLGAPRPTYRSEPEDQRHPHRHPGRAAIVTDTAGRAYGSLGEVHPRVVEAWGLVGRPVDAAIDLGRLLALAPDVVRARPVPAAQPVDRDLAVVVADDVPVGEVLRIARTSAGPILATLGLFDVYRGDQIGPGRVSYALAFRFQPLEAGDEADVDRALNKVRGSLKHHLGAEIR